VWREAKPAYPDGLDKAIEAAEKGAHQGSEEEPTKK
jgi:hypothetical protein